MTEHSSGQQKGVAEPAPAPAPAPEITPYRTLVSQVSAAITQAVMQIPGYDADLSGVPRSVRRSVSAEFLDMTATAVDASSELQGVNQLDAAECRDTVQLADAIDVLMDHLRSVTRRLSLVKRSRFAKAARGALGIYSIAKRVAQNPNNTHVVVHVENLKAELRRKRIGRQAKVPAGPVPTAPIPAPQGGAATQKAA
jgi:hypothetical protein